MHPPVPPPKAIYPLHSNLNPEIRPEADHPVKDNDESYKMSDKSEKVIWTLKDEINLSSSGSPI